MSKKKFWINGCTWNEEKIKNDRAHFTEHKNIQRLIANFSRPEMKANPELLAGLRNLSCGVKEHVSKN